MVLGACVHGVCGIEGRLGSLCGRRKLIPLWVGESRCIALLMAAALRAFQENGVARGCFCGLSAVIIYGL